MALDIKPSDEIITTPFSFFATAETILLVGAKPIFIDIRKDSYNLDYEKLEMAISSKTKASEVPSIPWKGNGGQRCNGNK